MEGHCLVVAADSHVRDTLATDLRRKDFNVSLADSGAQAERVLQNVTVQTVFIESHLVDMTAADLRDRIEVLRPDCRVVLLTSFGLVRNKPELLRYGASDYLVRLEQLADLVGRDAPAARTAGSWDEPTNQALIQVIDVLVGLLELGQHRFAGSSHVAMELARATAEELDTKEETLYEVVLGALLRDVDRTGPEHDPTSDATFTDEERNRFVDEHIKSSLQLFEHIDFPWKVLSVVRHHHERYNGTGAPDGLRGREIPMGARIVAVIDAYVALTTGKGDDSMNPEDALKLLTGRTGHQFDPEVVEAFHRVIDKRLLTRKSRRKPLVVVLDPDAQFRRVLKVRLANVGLKVRETQDLEKCKEFLLKELPDLAVVGIDEDPQEAFVLLQEMQQDENLCRIPTVFVSARPDRALRIRALRHGVDDFLNKSDNLDETVARLENILIRGAIRSDGEGRRARRGITGSLENLSLPDIVQTLTIGMKTACVTVTSDERTGRIWFENGTPKHAESDCLGGEQAFYEMVRWESGEFVIEHGAKPPRSSIESDAMYLLMEGLRMIDEESGGVTQAAS